MKKNVFSRAIAVLASTAVLGAASMMSASAAGATVSVGSATAAPGETVTLDVMIDSANLDSVDALVTYDASLNGTAATLMSGVSGDSAVGDGQTSLAVFSGSALPSGTIAQISFTVPESAQDGDSYPVSISLNTVGQADPAEDVTGDSSAVAGTITVQAKEPDTTAPVEPTTAEPVQSDTAEVTTAKPAAAAKTVAKAATGSPKTGTAGVAVAVAGLVTAGAAAVVLKKRH